MTVPNGAALTADEMRDRAQQYRDVAESVQPSGMTQLAYANVYVLLEALAKTNDDLTETVQLLTRVSSGLVSSIEETAQLRKEFEALKSQIVRERR